MSPTGSRGRELQGGHPSGSRIRSSCRGQKNRAGTWRDSFQYGGPVKKICNKDILIHLSTFGAIFRGVHKHYNIERIVAKVAAVVFESG